MKKKLALALAATMAFSIFTGCGPKEPAPAGSSNPPAVSGSQSKPQTSDLKAAVFYYNFADPYITTVRTAMDKELKALGIEHQNFDATTNQGLQTDQVNTAITDGYNLLIINVVDNAAPDAAQAMVNAAKEKNIPVILFNREVDDSVIKSYEASAFVGTDAPEAGHMQGKMIGEYLLANYDKYDLNGDGEISYVMFKGQEGNAEAEARTQYAVEDADAMLKEAGKPALKFYDAKNDKKYLVDQTGAWGAQAATDYMSVIMSEYNDANKNMVELVIANNDGMAEGAISALQGVGFNNDASKAIPVFGVDALASACEKIDAGQMAGTVKQDGEAMAATIAALVKNIQNGAAIMDNTSSYNVDEGVAKIRVPYALYTK